MGNHGLVQYKKIHRAVQQPTVLGPSRFREISTVRWLGRKWMGVWANHISASLSGSPADDGGGTFWCDAPFCSQLFIAHQTHDQTDVYAMPSNSQAIGLSTTNNTQHVIQYQPEGNWSYHQARTLSYTRNWYIRAWYRKLIFMFLSIAFLAGAIALYVQYKSLGSALVNMFLRGYFWAACMPILLFLYVFVCVIMEDFFLLPHKSATFAWITWIMYVLVLLTGVSFWILMAITF